SGSCIWSSMPRYSACSSLRILLSALVILSYCSIETRTARGLSCFVMATAPWAVTWSRTSAAEFFNAVAVTGGSSCTLREGWENEGYFLLIMEIMGVLVVLSILIILELRILCLFPSLGSEKD